MGVTRGCTCCVLLATRRSPCMRMLSGRVDRKALDRLEWTLIRHTVIRVINSYCSLRHDSSDDGWRWCSSVRWARCSSPQCILIWHYHSVFIGMWRHHVFFGTTKIVQSHAYLFKVIRLATRYRVALVGRVWVAEVERCPFPPFLPENPGNAKTREQEQEQQE